MVAPLPEEYVMLKMSDEFFVVSLPT